MKDLIFHCYESDIGFQTSGMCAIDLSHEITPRLCIFSIKSEKNFSVKTVINPTPFPLWLFE